MPDKTVYQPTNKPTNLERTTVSAETGAAAPRPLRKRWSAEKRALLVDVADACKRHNQPHITEKAKDIFLGAIGDLLNGGYDLALIRSVALTAALEYDDIRGYSKLSQLRMRVRAAADLIELDRHTKQKKAEKTPFPLATMADVKRLDPRRPLDERQDAAIDGAERALGFRSLPPSPTGGNRGDSILSNGRRNG